MIEITQNDTYTGSIILTAPTQYIDDGTKYRVITESITYNSVTYYKGELFTGTATTVYTGDGTFGEVIDITGWTFYITVKLGRYDTDAEAILLKEVDVLTDPTNGYMEYTITSIETSLMDEGLYWIEIKYKDIANHVRTIYLAQAFRIKDSLLDTL